MGSRRGRYAALVVAFVGGCAVGAPPGFSQGESWTIPLIGPLEDGLLLVPALVNGKGPYVFAIDPDAHVSIVDQQVVEEVHPRVGEGPHMLDESDTQQSRFFAEILEWRLGTLTVQQKSAQIVAKGVFDTDGRRVHGVIGRDIIADSLVFGFDRDLGVVMISTQKGAGSQYNVLEVKYSTLPSQIANAEVLSMPRRLVTATIGGQRFAMHLDLGALLSQLRPRSWAKAKLVESDRSLILVDEIGMPRTVAKQGLGEVTVGGATANNVVFVPYGDKRWPDQDLEGTLGLSFFKSFAVTVNWDKSTYYLRPRKNLLDQLVMRVGRWQSKTLAACKEAGCVKATLIDPVANRPPEEQPAVHPGLVATFRRDPSAKQLDLEVLYSVTPAAGKPPLNWLVVNLPAGADRALTHLSADYLGATLTLLDVSLFPRRCPAAGGCVDMLAPPQPITAGTEGRRQNVPPTALTLRTGEKGIVPSDDDKATYKGQVRASVKVCADATGTIDGVTLIEPSSMPNYDALIVSTIRSSWSYEPFVFGGKPIPFCTAVTFIYTQK